MNENRRLILKMTTLVGLMAANGMITAAFAQEWNKTAFDAKSLEEVMKAFNSSPAEKSAAITLNAPDIAENGAVVPVGISTTLKATQMAILVEKNPNPLAAQFFILDGVEPFITTRVKMGQSSNVFALVKADNKWFFSSKEIKVTLGGCGG